MSRNTKQSIAVILIAAILVVAWWGSYAPLRKAEIFIATLQGLQTTPASSLQDLETRLAVPLDYGSPIGQEELVRNMSNNILNFVQHGGNATTTAQLLDFMHHYYDPIVAQGKGMSFNQDLYLLGAIHETAFVQTRNPQYLAAAQQYYEESLMLGPNRPQSLYGMFDVYRFEGNVASATVIGQKILTLWPTDKNISQALSQLLAQPQLHATSTPAQKK